jgi:hypothetical protein
VIGLTPKIPLCPPCRDERSRWLGYRLPRTPGFAFGSGAPYDVSPAGIRDRQHARFEEWRSTVAFHRDLIARTCREQRHSHAPAVPRVVEIPLFDLAGGRS